MAFVKKDFDFFGFKIDVYAKISQLTVTETGADEAGKTYVVKATVSWFTNESKQHQFSQSEEIINDAHIEDANLQGAYIKLAQSDRFKDFINV